MRDWGSFWAGALLMNEEDFFRHWAIKLIGPPQWVYAKWWLHYWTPAWHKGRGPYVSIGLGFFAIYRGY
jgi:hypothetical protein